jgi:hypothetical protein
MKAPTQDHFIYGGFSGPADVWDGCFAAAWNERVLPGPPRLPFLHMTDIRDWNWQRRFGLQPWDADRRLDAAADVIRSTGRLVPVVVHVHRSRYEEVIRRPFTPEPNRKKVQLDPDYLCFLWSAFLQLEWLQAEFADEVERVDFRAERNGAVTPHGGLHRSLVSALAYIGKQHQIPLVGNFSCVQKDNIASQAADMLTWHARNYQRGKLDRAGYRRLWRMIIGGRENKTRVGRLQEISAEAMQQLSEAFDKYPSALERPPYDTSEAADI